MPYSGERVLVAVLRWTARAIGIVILLLLVFGNLLKYDGDLPDFLLGISPRESPILMGELIIAIGLIVAWKWEGLGSILILGGAAFLTIVNYGLRAEVFVPLLLTVLLFLCCWWRTPKRKGGRRIIAGVVLLMLLAASAVALNALRERVIDRDCERAAAWVRSNHPAPGSYPSLPMPAEFRWLSIHGGVDATVLKDGTVVLLLKTLIGWKDNWEGIIYSSSPLKPSETAGQADGWIQIRDTPEDSYLVEAIIETKVNDRLYFVKFDLNYAAPQSVLNSGTMQGERDIADLGKFGRNKISIDVEYGDAAALREHKRPSLTVVPGREMMKEYEFTIVTERDEDGRFVAICPALQGCYTEGETEEEALTLVEDAVRLHLQDRLDAGEPIHEEIASRKVRVAV